MTMTATTASVQRDSQRHYRLSVEHTSEHAITSLRAAFDTELSLVIDRLMTASAAETDAALERARASGQTVLDTALADLVDQIRQKDASTESVLQLEGQVAGLKSLLEEAREKNRATLEACERELGARERAEAAHAQAVSTHKQLVSQYEAKLLDVQAELDAARVALISLKRQLESQPSERARFLEALMTVQQACVLAESKLAAPAEPNAAPDDNCDPPTTASPAAPGRSLKLVAPAETAAVDASPELVEYLKELFDQLEAAYWVDHRAHGSAEVVQHLRANLRTAHDAFERRFGPEHTNLSMVFQNELSARLDASGATSLGRHLAVAAFELDCTDYGRAEAS